jgi:hypothetical protein
MVEQNRNIQLKYDAETETFIVVGSARDPLVGPYVGRVFTFEDLRNAGATFDTTKTGDYKFANLSAQQIKELPAKDRGALSKATKGATAEEARELREGKPPEEQEYAYRQGRLVTEKNISNFVFQDPITRQVKFITADTPSADVVGGTAEGGVPSPTFAMIVPKQFSSEVITGGTTGAIVYDGSVVQERFIKQLISENKVSNFKNKLIEKGYYLLAGYNDIATQESLRQGETADEIFGIAVNKYLNELSIANLQNVEKGLNPFGINEYIENVQPDYDALSAYVPSERDAEQALKATYANYVGRLPSAEELSAFKLALESEAKSKPRVTQPDFATGMQTTYEGFTADQLDAFATEYTLERPEAEEFGAGQGGLNAISNVFGRIVQNARNEMANAVTPGSL